MSQRKIWRKMKKIPTKCPVFKSQRRTIGYCFKITALIFAAALLCGCTIFEGSLESLLSPPKLTEVQTAIYDALILSTGEQIELVYPMSGEHRSPFVLYNLDSEKGDEAIVFYRVKSMSDNNESSLRMNFLDQTESGWVSMLDRPIAGIGIESVNFYNFNDDVSIALTCTALTQTERSLLILKYADGQVDEQFRSSFNFLQATDLDNDSFDELFLVNYDTVMGYNHAHLLGSVLSADSETYSVGVISSVPLSTDVSSIQMLTRQKLNENASLLFIDYSKGDNAYGTQALLSYKNNLTQVISEGMSRRSNSNTPIQYSTDIDGDGRVEVPVTVALPGYENRTVPEQLYQVDWYYADEENNNTLIKKYTTYVNSGGDYLFYIPVRWQGLVTVEKGGGAVRFVKYDENSTLLLAIMLGDSPPQNEEGWEKYVDGVYINASEKDDPMVLTEDELHNCLKFFFAT